MKGCENSVCTYVEECLLEQYCIWRKTNTLEHRSELAEAIILFKPKCLKIDEIYQTYSEEIADSQKALQQKRNLK